MDIKNTFRVYKTLVEMLTDRGYSMSKDIDYEEFTIMYLENNYDITDNDEKIHVAFYKDTKTFGKKDLENIVQNVKDKFENDEIKIIIILREKYNVTIEKELANPKNNNVEIFIFKNLTFNMTRHQDMAKHTPLSEEEIEEVAKQYRISKKEFPKMLATDPIAKYYGVKSGGMFKVVRPSYSSGEYVTYRIVR
jgi:DNA-directed RNA polymerase I, II, and III subunit RPABC1